MLFHAVMHHDGELKWCVSAPQCTYTVHARNLVLSKGFCHFSGRRPIVRCRPEAVVRKTRASGQWQPVLYIGSSVTKQINERLVLVSAVMVVAISIAVTTVFWHYRIKDPDRGGGAVTLRTVTFTDAVMTCQKETRAKLGADLISVSVDDHSSRYDHKSNVYKLFFNALVLSKRSETGRANLAVYCFVRADQGRISHFEQVEQKDDGEAAPVKGDGGLFGWPM